MWNDTLLLRCEDQSRDCLHLSLMQWSMLGTSYPVGETSIPLSDVQPDVPVNSWYNLKEYVISLNSLELMFSSRALFPLLATGFSHLL